MEILTSGSFINLENKEKIEQLIFTAREMAQAAIETEGFANLEESNKNLAREIWQGAEYLCRETETALIQNIFISNFLDGLREHRGQTNPAESLSKIAPNLSTAVSVVESVPPKDVPQDEFLGIVAPPNTPENTDSVINSAGAKMETESPLSNLLPVQDNPPQIAQDSERLAERISAESADDEFLAVETLPPLETTDETQPEPENSEKPAPKESQVASAKQESSLETSLPTKQANNKEPYRWEKCTVTATIQLLPSGTESRKAVLTVRTHDFTPQITLIEISGEATPAALLPFLENAFETYRNNLPLKVMEKMKQEKAKGKKQPTKTATVTQTAEVTKPQTVSTQADEKGQVKTTQLSPPPRQVHQAQESLQGTLF